MPKTDKLDKQISLSEIEELVILEEKEFQKKIKKIINDDYKNQCERFQYLNDEILKLIDNIDRRINYWENRRTLFLQIALGIIAASIGAIIAVLPLISSNFDTQSLVNFNFIYIPLCLSFITLIGGGIHIVWMWNRQNNPSYPFTKAFRVWRWQYRYAEQPDKQIDTTIQNKDKYPFIAEAKKFHSNLMNYKNMTISSDIDELLDQNLSQLYLLITNEKYKIKFINALRDLLSFYLSASVVIFFVTLFVILILA